MKRLSVLISFLSVLIFCSACLSVNEHSLNEHPRNGQLTGSNDDQAETAIYSLVMYGEDVNANSNALAMEAHMGHADTVRHLIEKGADVNARDDIGMTVLMHAAYSRNADVVRFLIEKGADVNAVDRGGMNALSYARDNEDVTKVLQMAMKK